MSGRKKTTKTTTPVPAQASPEPAAPVASVDAGAVPRAHAVTGTGLIRLDMPTFRRAIRAVLIAASDDEARAHLNCLHFRASSAMLTVEATDGQMFARWTGIAADGELDVLVPKAPLAAFLRLLTSDLAGDRNLDLFSSNLVEIRATGGCRLHHVLAGTVPFTKIDAEYPVIDRIIPPRHRSSVGHVSLSAENLDRAGKIFKHAARKEGATLRFGEQNDVVMLTNPMAKGLIVGIAPMIFDDEDDEG